MIKVQTKIIPNHFIWTSRRRDNRWRPLDSKETASVIISSKLAVNYCNFALIKFHRKKSGKFKFHPTFLFEFLIFNVIQAMDLSFDLSSFCVYDHMKCTQAILVCVLARLPREIFLHNVENNSLGIRIYAILKLSAFTTEMFKILHASYHEYTCNKACGV